MEKQPPPIRIIAPGRVYRRDNADATHNPTFQQIEGLYVDKGVTVGDLKGTVEFVFKELLGDDVKIRFRPHYFSYTEPSFEIDFTSALVKKMGKDWLEIAGCGMVHPQVFENVGYDPEVWTGWAFGFGIERIAMIRYGINDIRLFYENDVRFLNSFRPMKVTLNWLKQYVDFNWSPEELARAAHHARSRSRGRAEARRRVRRHRRRAGHHARQASQCRQAFASAASTTARASGRSFAARRISSRRQSAADSARALRCR